MQKQKLPIVRALWLVILVCLAVHCLAYGQDYEIRGPDDLQVRDLLSGNVTVLAGSRLKVLAARRGSKQAV